MKSKALLIASMAYAMGGMMYEEGKGSRSREPERDSSPVKKVIPKGCKEYVFQEEFGTLTVIAINYQSACKKYNRWCKENDDFNQYEKP
jgi:hypothetical protein